VNKDLIRLRKLMSVEMFPEIRTKKLEGSEGDYLLRILVKEKYAMKLLIDMVLDTKLADVSDITQTYASCYYHASKVDAGLIQDQTNQGGSNVPGAGNHHNGSKNSLLLSEYENVRDVIYLKEKGTIYCFRV